MWNAVSTDHPLPPQPFWAAVCITVFLIVQIQDKNFPMRFFLCCFYKKCTVSQFFTDITLESDRKPWYVDNIKAVKNESQFKVFSILSFEEWMFSKSINIKILHNPNDFLTVLLAISSNLVLSSLHILEASTLAADSSFGSANMDTTDNKIFSTDWTGDHLSADVSYPIGSSPGACSIEMHTRPSG